MDIDSVMNVSDAQLTLADWEHAAVDMDWTDVATMLVAMGDIKGDILLELERLWDVTKEIDGKVFHVGRIILKIIDFIKAHPNIANVMLIGAAIGSLISMIPLIGSVLGPLATTICAFLGFASGARLYILVADTPFQKLVMIAKDFFATLAEIFDLTNMFDLLKDH